MVVKKAKEKEKANAETQRAQRIRREKYYWSRGEE